MTDLRRRFCGIYFYWTRKKKSIVVQLEFNHNFDYPVVANGATPMEEKKVVMYEPSD